MLAIMSLAVHCDEVADVRQPFLADIGGLPTQADERIANLRALQDSELSGDFKMNWDMPWSEPTNLTKLSTVQVLMDSPVMEYQRLLQEWFFDPDGPQVIIAVVVIMLGFGCCIGGHTLWPVIVVSAVAILGCSFVHYVDITVGVSGAMWEQIALPLIIGSILVWAAIQGIRGVDVLVGAFTGLSWAYYTGSWARALDGEDSEVHMACFIWYTLGALMGVVLFGFFPQYVLCASTPVCGGVLLVSGTFYLLGLTSAFSWLLPVEVATAWAYAAKDLLGSGGLYLLAWELGFVILVSPLGSNPDMHIILAIIVVVVILVGGLETSVGFGCTLFNICPSWLQPVEGDRAFPWVGSLLWALAAGLGTYTQVSMVPEKDASRKKEKKSKENYKKKDTISASTYRSQRQSNATQEYDRLPTTQAGGLGSADW